MLKLNPKTKKKIVTGAITCASLLLAVCVWGFYVPMSFSSQKTVFYQATSGVGNAQIATDLSKQGIINSKFFFQLYSVITGNATKLQAGLYDFSPNMSIAAIVKKLSSGDVAKNKVTILEGWTIQDISAYLAKKQIYPAQDFYAATHQDYSAEFDFLKSKPKSASLEGFLYPDTYYVPVGTSAPDFVRMILTNFGKKLTPDMRKQITANKKTIFQTVNMASIVEKEVPTLQDKKMISGILWKRIANGMPLQVDATVNYITGKNDAAVTVVDTKIDSPYNTYKYYGLPAGPISNPGIDSLKAAIYPTQTAYWFWFSSGGRTFYSKTYQEHSASAAKYLN